MPDTPRSVTPEDFDFEAVYHGEPPLPGMTRGFDAPPWDIGEPQPAVIELEETGQLRSEILDAGCGLGEHAIFLAQRGYRVTGFDFAATAVEQARERARSRAVDVEFLMADATRLDGLPPRFNTVLDSALYHCLGDQQRTAYAAALHRVTRPGAQLHLFCFADAPSPGIRMPNQVGQDDLRNHLASHWDILGIEPGRYSAVFDLDFLREQQNNLGPLFELNLDEVRTDSKGRVTVPMWYVRAERLEHPQVPTDT